MVHKAINNIAAVLLTGLLLLVIVYAKAGEAPKVDNTLEKLRYKVGQEKQNDIRALKTEMLVSKSEELAIKQAKMLIKKYKGMAIEADLQLRLAELYMRRAKSERFFELNRESEFAINLAPQRISKASSKKVVRQAITIYDSLEKRFPNYDKIDVVVFNNAFARQQIGQVKTAEGLYWKVVKKYPYSNLVPDCHLAIGEMAFRQKRFKVALVHFESIKKYPDSRVYPYGLYKTAWTQYNLRHTRVAMNELERVVAYGKMIEEQNLDSRLDLRKEALSDMALFYGEVYRADKAYKYFASQAKNSEIGDLIMKLARIYDRHSKYDEKDLVLRDFIDEHPVDKVVPEIYDQLVWNYEKMKDRTKVVKQLKDFQKLCSAESRWGKVNLPIEVQIDTTKQKLKEPTPLETCNEELRKSSLKLANKWLNIWKKNVEYKEFAQSSEEAFVIFLHENPVTNKVNKARFAYAQLLFQQNKFKAASEQYDFVGLHTEENELGHEARYAAILSYEKAISKGKWSEQDEVLFAGLVEKYATHHPKGKFRLDVEFKRALIAYEKSNYAVAAPIFRRLGESYNNSEKGIKAQDLYLDILNHNKDFVALKDYSKGLLGQKLKDPQRADKIREIYEQAYFLEVQSYDEKGEVAKAIKEYKLFAISNSKSPLAEKAWWNAVQLHFRVDDFKGGAKAAHMLFEKFPKSGNVVGALLKSAQAYESMGQLEKASEVLVKLSKVDVASKWKWLSLAADFNLLDGKIRHAKKLYESLKGSGEKNIAFHALVQLEKIEKKSGSLNNREKLLKEIILSGRQPHASLAQLYFIEKLYSNKEYSKAFTEAMKVLNMNSNASIYAKSRSRFIQALILEGEYRTQSVQSQLDRFTTVFAIKTEKLEKAQRAYQSAIRYGDPKVAVDSMLKLAKLYSAYVEMLKTMPVPSGLPDSEVSAFRAEMNKLVIPMEEKGVETLLEALTQAKRLKLRDGSVPLLQSELDKLNMRKSAGQTSAIEAPLMALPKTAEVGS